ncbi:MAG: hypothetical protein SGPRY_004388, partial [Prymnesium sp.]
KAAASEDVKAATSRQEALLKELKAVEDEHAVAQCVRQPEATRAEAQAESTELRNNAIRNLAKERHVEQAHNNARREKEWLLASLRRKYESKRKLEQARSEAKNKTEARLAALKVKYGALLMAEKDEAHERKVREKGETLEQLNERKRVLTSIDNNVRQIKAKFDSVLKVAACLAEGQTDCPQLFSLKQAESTMCKRPDKCYVGLVDTGE